MGTAGDNNTANSATMNHNQNLAQKFCGFTYIKLTTPKPGRPQSVLGTALVVTFTASLSTLWLGRILECLGGTVGSSKLGACMGL